MLRFTVVLVVVFSAVGISAQDPGQQMTFGSEMDVMRPVKVPSSFLPQLGRGDRQQLARCQTQPDYPALRKKSRSDYFVGSLLNVRGKIGALDLLIVQSNSGCFYGAHNARFWILGKRKRESAMRYTKRFEIQADGLTVSAKTTRYYPDLEVFSHTAVEGFTSTYRYSQGRYRVIYCYAEQLGDDSPKPRRIRCSKYNWEFRK